MRPLPKLYYFEKLSNKYGQQSLSIFTHVFHCFMRWKKIFWNLSLMKTTQVVHSHYQALCLWWKGSSPSTPPGPCLQFVGGSQTSCLYHLKKNLHTDHNEVFDNLIVQTLSFMSFVNIFVCHKAVINHRTWLCWSTREVTMKDHYYSPYNHIKQQC